MAAIWQNEFRRKTRHSVTFSLIYRDEVVRMLKIKGDSCHDFRHIRTGAKRDANRRPMSGVAKVSPNMGL